MKICIAGSREFVNRELVYKWMEINFYKDEDVLINGNCSTGVDAWALHYGQSHDLQLRIYNPNWEKYGKRAGPIRNEEMVKDSDKIVCFWDGQSPGTRSTIEFALKYKKDLEVIFG